MDEPQKVVDPSKKQVECNQAVREVENQAAFHDVKEEPGKQNAQTNDHDDTGEQFLGDGKQAPGSDEKSTSSGSSERKSSRQYCTQKCLLGLKLGQPLDMNCPNSKLHSGESTTTNHPIDYKQFHRLLGKQLRQTLDDGMVLTNKRGNLGILFQVILLSYGYTFVSKATTARHGQTLWSESKIYYRLRHLQGVSIPVFLGKLDLQTIGQNYSHPDGDIEHMILLSYGGEDLNSLLIKENISGDLRSQLFRSLSEVHEMGVKHGSVARRNVLWNKETSRLMLVDFQRAKFVDLTKKSRADGRLYDPQKVRVGPYPMREIDKFFEDDLGDAWDIYDSLR